jgi:hypothetical protein
MSWQPLDAIVLFLFATLYTGLYALLGGHGYRRLLVGWLASLSGAVIGYFVGHVVNLQILWLGSVPWLEMTLGSAILLVVASRLRI